MRRMKYIVAILLVVLLMTGCSRGKGQNDVPKLDEDSPLQAGDILYQTWKDGALADIDTNMPAKIEVGIDKHGEETLYVIENDESVKEAIELFKNVTVAGGGYSVTDNYNSISFVYEDGTSNHLSFELWYLALSSNGSYYNYELADLQEFLDYAYEHADNVYVGDAFWEYYGE